MALVDNLSFVFVVSVWIFSSFNFGSCNTDDLSKLEPPNAFSAPDGHKHARDHSSAVTSDLAGDSIELLGGVTTESVITPQHQEGGDNTELVDAKTHFAEIDSQDEVVRTDDEMSKENDEIRRNRDETVQRIGNVAEHLNQTESGVNERKDNDTTGHGPQTHNSSISNSDNATQDLPQNQDNDKVNSCPRCGNKKKVREARIEMLKQTILDKLGLAEAPKLSEPIQALPFDFYRGEDFHVSDEDLVDYDRNMVKTREIFIYGKDITDKCRQKGGTVCYSFNITNKRIKPSQIHSVELWVYKRSTHHSKRRQTFMVSELEWKRKRGEDVLYPKNIVKRLETGLKHGWMKIYVKRSVLRWFSKPERNNGLAIVCKTCKQKHPRAIYGTKHGNTPFLVFYMKNDRPSNHRSRRGVQCTEGGNNCCHREPLEIRFRDIGWDYIMAPEYIRPDYCVGSCNGIQAAHHNHTLLVQSLRNTVTHSDNGALQPCCSPVSFRRPQSLIYKDHAGDVRKIDLPDLIVGECGCT